MKYVDCCVVNASMMPAVPTELSQPKVSAPTTSAVSGTFEAFSAAFSGSLWYLNVVMFLSTFAFQLPSPSLPNFVKMLGWGLAQTSQVRALTFVSQLGGLLLVPTLFVRLSLKPKFILQLSSAAAALGFGIVVWSGVRQSLALLWASRIPLLLQQFVVAARMYGVHHTPHAHVGIVTTQLVASATLGRVLGPLVGGWLASYSLLAPPVIAGLVSLISSILLLAFAEDGEAKSSAKPPVGVLDHIRTFRVQFQEKVELSLWAKAEAALFLSHAVFVSVLPPYLTRTFDVSVTTIGLIASLGELTTLLAPTFMTPYLSTLFGDRAGRLSTAATSLCAISSLTLVFAPSPVLTVVGFLLGVAGSVVLEGQLIAAMKRQLTTSDGECVTPVSQALALAVRAVGSPIAATAFLSIGVQAVGFVSTCALFYFNHTASKAAIIAKHD